MDITQQRYKVTEFNETLQAAVKRLFSENPQAGAELADNLDMALTLADWDQPGEAVVATAIRLSERLGTLYQDRGNDPFFGSD